MAIECPCSFLVQRLNENFAHLIGWANLCERHGVVRRELRNSRLEPRSLKAFIRADRADSATGPMFPNAVAAAVRTSTLSSSVTAIASAGTADRASDPTLPKVATEKMRTLGFESLRAVMREGTIDGDTLNCPSSATVPPRLRASMRERTCCSSMTCWARTPPTNITANTNQRTSITSILHGFIAHGDWTTGRGPTRGPRDHGPKMRRSEMSSRVVVQHARIGARCPLPDQLLIKSIA